MTFLVLSCVLSLVLGLLSWCTARCACVSPVLFCVWCWVSLAGVSKFIKFPASGSSDLIYNNLKTNKTTYKSYNNIDEKETKSNK